MNNVQVLDCTLRDGGLGLEDAAVNNISSAVFSLEDRQKITEILSKTNIDIIEIGSIELSDNDKSGYAIYRDIKKISEKIPLAAPSTSVYAALYRGPDTPIENIPKWDFGLCKAVRVIIRYSELKKSLEFCASLSEKGYMVFVQPMLTMRYTDEEIDLLISEANKMNAYALYFVDSYGYMNYENIERLFEKYNEKLSPDIRIGFHAHNNMNMAFANVLYLIEHCKGRKIIIDSCIMGMGQGAGNLQTELLIGYLRQNGIAKYNYPSILDACEIIDKYNQNTLWGYSVTRLLPALHKCAYKYSIALHNHYGLTYSEIDSILSNIPENLRHRYTPQNTVDLLKVTGFADKIGGKI